MNKKNVYVKFLGNRSLLLLWGGQTTSIMGDLLFNMAIMWSVYAHSQSILQSALVGVVWHLTSALFSPLAGVMTDRFDRKRTLISLYVLSALATLGFGSIVFFYGHLSIGFSLFFIFFINCLGVFYFPIETSIMPQIVEKQYLSYAAGTFSSIKQSAQLFGSMVAGFIISLLGVGLAITLDSLSFIVVAVLVFFIKVPNLNGIKVKKEKLSLVNDIKSGWRYIRKSSILFTLMWVALLLNMASFTGSIYPALVSQQLHGGAEILGLIEAFGFVGGIVAGFSSGHLFKRIKPGMLTVLFWVIAGLCTIGIGLSTNIYVTLGLEFFDSFALTGSAVCLNTIEMTIISNQYRGRVFGIIRGLSIVLVPLSTLFAGVLGDVIGVTPLFAIAGIWLMIVALIAFSNKSIRLFRMDEEERITQSH
ncbi:MFS family permease [Pullulanibacillus pueri]|uniref:MFS transporter n=1 Tax=Pullulanibacillus pueri TaxID=1437324 RepID=A0A8J2ZUW7_9BACL|nr:MFS transporter [Pullulanibacillus pueri]MBM7680838.1 MFS family permease [Pullulanibacillus pueri]GGH78530.1 MFS transporter [Pullulanibacillus pueri]